MARRFHIEGTEQFGYSMVNRYLHSFYVYMNTVQRICKLYNYAPVHFLKGYVAHSCCVIGEALGLLDRMNQYVLDFYEDENLYILQGLLEPEIRDKILACYDEKHRPSIAEWERKFTNNMN